MKNKLFIIVFLFVFFISGCSNKNNNTLDNIIGQDNNNEVDETIIQENKNKMISCLENELSGYITSEKNELSDLILSEITDKDDRIQYYKGIKTSNNDMYVIYKNTPSEFEVLKDFDLYFSKKYSVYQRYSFNNGINVLIHNALNDVNFKEIEKKCNVSNYEPDKIIDIPTKTINKINNTTIIIIKSGNNKLGTIEDKDTITDVLDIIGTSHQYSYKDINEGYLCDGYAFEFEMYNDKGKKLDTIYVWHDGTRLIPKSIHSGCSYFSTTSDKDLRKIIEEETNYKFYGYSDYEDECAEELELIYEDKDYRYYLRCIKSDKVLIHFDISNLTMNVKYALNNNYINVNQLVLYNDLMIKEKK